MKIAMIGTGYVGLVSGTCFAALGHEVVCVDTDAQKIGALNAGRIPFYEPGLAELVAKSRAEGRLSFNGDLKAALKGVDAVFICVGTPGRPEDGTADLRFVDAAAAAVGAALRGFRRRHRQIDRADRHLRRRRENHRRRGGRPRIRRRLQSGILARRRGDQRLHEARPHRRRRRGRARQSDDGGDLQAADGRRRADPVHAPPLGGTDQIRRQRVSGDEGDLHQRDRRPVRSGRGRHRRRRRRRRPRPAHRPALPERRSRLRRLVLSRRTRWR